MCSTDSIGASVAGAAGGGAPAKPPGSVAGASGAPDTVTGGGAGDLAAMLEQLASAISALQGVLEGLGSTASGGGPGGCGCGGAKSGVAGVRGGSASKKEFVAPVAVEAIRTRSEDHGYEQRVLELVNAERARHGLAPLRYNALLDSAAEKHADHMSRVGAMAHDGIGDGSPGERIRAEGFRNAWGENVATGQLSPEQVVREWLNSPSHRRNILDPNFRQLGVSYETSATGRSYWAQEFGR